MVRAKWNKLLIHWNENKHRLQASAFSFIALNLAEKVALHIFLIMVNTFLGELCIENCTKQATDITSPVDTGHKLNVHKTFRRRPRRLLNILMYVQFTSCVYGVQRRALFKENHGNTKRINFQFHYCKFSKQRNFILFITSSALLEGGEGEVSPALSWKLEKSALILGKKVLILIIYRINFLLKIQFLGFSCRKSSKFFPVRPFIFLFLMNIKVP